MPSQWNVAFGTPPSSATQSSPPLRPPPTGTGNNYELRSPQDGTPSNYQIPHVSPQAGGLSSTQSQVPTTTTFATPTATYVTPTMWQEVVASSFQDGLKRRWTRERDDPRSRMRSRFLFAVETCSDYMFLRKPGQERETRAYAATQSVAPRKCRVRLPS